MAYPQGINFRATSGYVTDGSNEYGYTFLDAFNGTYPKTTTQGNTVGFEQGVGNSRDRNSALDRRLAGVLFGGLADFRFDLPSTGSYNVRLAAGDASNATTPTVSLVDGTTVLATMSSGGSTSAGSFRDANDTALTAANWPGSNASRNATFATTICRFRVASGTSVAHMYVESAGASPDVSVSLTGQAATVSAGSVIPATSRALSGQGATSAAGTVVPTHSSALTGQSANAAQGTVSASGDVAVTLTGISATTQAGSIAAATARSLTGQQGTASADTLTQSRSLTLSGQSATATAGIVIPGLTRSITGQSASIAQGSLTGGVSTDIPAPVYFVTIMRLSQIDQTSSMGDALNSVSSMSSTEYAATIMRAAAVNSMSNMSSSAIYNRTELI